MNLAPLLLSTRVNSVLLGAALSVVPVALCGQSLFHRIYQHGGYPGQTQSALRLPSGSFILFSGGLYPQCGGLSKVNSDGTMVWDQRVEFPAMGGGGSMVATALLDDEQKLVLAFTGRYPSDGALVRMDTNGTVLWTLQIEHPLADVILTDDGNYAVFGGATLAAEGSDWDIYFYKVAPDGTVLTSKHYVNGNGFINYNNLDKTGYELVQDASGSYYLAFMYGVRTCLMKLDATGQFQWMKVLWEDAYTLAFGSSLHSWRLFLRSDGDLLLCGKQGSFMDTRLLVATRLNNDGQVIASTRYDIPQGVDLNDAFLAPDSTIYLWCRMLSGGVVADHAVLRINQDRALLDTWHISTPTDHNVTGFGVDDDGGFDLFRLVPDTSLSSAPLEMERVDGTFTTDCDTTDHPVFTESTIAVAVIDSFPLMTYTAPTPGTVPMIFTPRTPTTLDACVITSVGSVADMGSSIVYPNPTNGLLHLGLDEADPIVRYRLINSTGALVLAGYTDQDPLDLEAWPAGVYHLQVWTWAGGMRVARVIKE